MKIISRANSFFKHWRRYRQFPNECYGCFRGVYSSFEEAIADAPKNKKVGYDHEDLAEWYAEELDLSIQEYDYPVLFWMKKCIQDDSKILDFGGNVGIHYMQYRRYINFGAEVKWTVYDLPEIAKAGNERNQYDQLHFISDLNASGDHDIFLASGSAQYIEDFSSVIDKLKAKPRHILITRLPLYDGERFVTLQNGGSVFYPQYVFNKDNFVANIEKQGYELKDSWLDRMGGCFIPFHPKKSLSHYHGLYFSLQ